MQTKNKIILALFSDVNFSPQLLAILQNLFDRKAEVRIVLIGNGNSQILTQMEIRGWNLNNIHSRGKIGSIINFILVSREIIRYRPHTLFASGQFATVIGILSAKLLNVPNRVFIRHHSSFHHKYKMKFGIIIDRISNRLATRIVAVSKVVEKILVEDELAVQDKITIIYNGVDLVNFRNKASISEAVSTQDIKSPFLFRVGVLSRLTEWKGVEYTAEAFVRLQKDFPNSYLHIVGAFSDSYLDVKNILSTVASHTYTLDRINSNIPHFLHGLDVFVHVPVGIDDEAFGIVYIEALSSGIPCIFTRSGVLNELESPDSYAHIVAFRNSEEIYLNLKKMIEGVNAMKIQVPESWLNQFSLDVMAKSYADLLLREDH